MYGHLANAVGKQNCPYTARPMLSFNDITLRRGARKLLEGLSLTVHAGDKLGVVGRNGTGKSSLFALVLGELAADAGEVGLPKRLRIATVRQETPALDCSALDYVLDGDAEYREIEQALAAAEAAQDAAAQAKLHERMYAIDGYAAASRAGRLLHGLAFEPEQQSQPVRAFSGGWRMRLNLAQALMCRSDLLLLDEPTNHLDLDAVIWLADWLRSYPGTLLLISHDREFMDATCQQILHLEHGGGTLYTGNYSSFEKTRAERLVQQQAQHQAQQRQIAHLQGFVDRFRAKASKARQAQSRLKQIERIEQVGPAHFDSPFSFEFAEPERLPNPMLRMDGTRAGYGNTVILSQLKLSLTPGDRIGLLGRNGAGKSTLIKTVAGALPSLGGEFFRDKHLRIGYFAQHSLEQLDSQASPLLHLQRLDPKATEQQLRSFLGGFDFRGDQALAPAGPFSGGEKARLALAQIVYQRPNLLLLDEPTNHLDLDMRHALELALQSFEGAMILVSHDRHLIDATCDRLWVVSGGNCQAFDGDLDDYARWLLRAASREPSESSAGEKAVSANKAKPGSPAQRRQEKPLRDALRRAEKQMEKLQQQIAKLDQTLADPALYQEAPERAAACAREQAELRAELETVEADWLAAMEALEG